MSGRRMTLPVERPLDTCAACGKRGRRKEWANIIRGSEVVGTTCPACPRADEPIRLAHTKSGTHYRVVVNTTPAGSRKREQVSRTVRTLDEARELVTQVRAEVAARGTFEPSKNETVAELCSRWLDSRVDVRTVTLDGYRYALAPALRRIGDREVTGVTVGEVEQLARWLTESGGKRSQGLKPRSVRAAFIALAQAFDVAANEETIASNPVRKAKRPRQRQAVGKDLEYWHAEQILTFRDAADEHALAGAWRLTLCGMTRADVLGLRWSDVDLVAGTVTVAQGRVAVSLGDGVDDPKSIQRRRTMPVEAIHPGTVALLRKLKAAQAADQLVAGPAWVNSGFVVVDALGSGPAPRSYSTQFANLCRVANVPVIRLHSVRHSLAFWLHSLGVTPADAAALLGHTVEVHLSTYLPASGAGGIANAASALGRAVTAS